ncbi:hypothetical protein Ga0466249_002293 [Sporomusaceae bacterium BoRhaA]|uniref:hypothetical protein n=1 Tax=Pelorhabdus rhamnosifermentans TaxID=2772457 RepID=UPI001C05F96C|nr:hypothetical protein [Pelorhabdus rhamnosifermentans]MBU2701179.1 hypothetical protein [Pelorhabdus rhamnosifermentans]
MQVKDYDPIIAILRSQLLTNTELASFIGTWTDADTGISSKAIYPSYLNSVANPVYPAITICSNSSGALKGGIPFDKDRYYIHGWSKNSDVAYLLNMIVDTLRTAPKGLVTCRKLPGTKCPLYDSDTQTHYFMSEWLIYANQNLIYA